jgi:hypothetical protein
METLSKAGKFMKKSVGFRFTTSKGQPLDKWEVIAMGYSFDDVFNEKTPVKCFYKEDWKKEYPEVPRLHSL